MVIDISFFVSVGFFSFSSFSSVPSALFPCKRASASACSRSSSSSSSSSKMSDSMSSSEDSYSDPLNKRNCYINLVVLSAVPYPSAFSHAHQRVSLFSVFRCAAGPRACSESGLLARV